ncbi:alpha/beta fold hydrolase [Microbulbifer pacificus]|uniref:Alpha/beta hydrolase n=1 Tax=Microbulbifer pacificus TaxID=407164 RepID=A0AAU0MZG3_9GAMM|nr:alpha/beta hydrolase [Microbulbifer pacificus]WOX05903.1 alpha/beta hydrolase [Microbulbifer pacificus]
MDQRRRWEPAAVIEPFPSTIRRGYLDAELCGEFAQLHFRSCGREEAPLVLLLHQTPSSSAMYQNLMPLLARDFFVLAIDTPGFGNSDPLPATFPGGISIAGFADAIYRAVSSKFDRPALVFGHHTGAAIAVQLAFDQPAFVRALALSGPTLLTDEQKAALPLAAQTIAADAEGAHWQRMWQRLRAKDPQAELSLSQREALLAFTCGDYYEASYRAVVEQDVVPQLAAIQCPTLVFAGGRDLLRAAVEPTVQLLPKGRAAELPEDAGTYVCDRQPAAVAELLQPFFLEIVRAG